MTAFPRHVLSGGELGYEILSSFEANFLMRNLLLRFGFLVSGVESW